jgi:23S rRNA A1618 N6-methylase RlmF
VLTVEGFDYEKVKTMIDESDLGAVQKTLMSEAIKKAQDNPELLKAALEKLRAAMKL